MPLATQFFFIFLKAPLPRRAREIPPKAAVSRVHIKKLHTEFHQDRIINWDYRILEVGEGRGGGGRPVEYSILHQLYAIVVRIEFQNSWYSFWVVVLFWFFWEISQKYLFFRQFQIILKTLDLASHSVIFKDNCQIWINLAIGKLVK